MPDEVPGFLSLDQRESTWQKLLERNAQGEFTLVAERDDDVVAFCSVIGLSRDDDADARTCEVAAIYVEPDWHKGIGSALLGAALQKLACAKWDHVTLWVFAENDPAVSFHRRFGFAPESRRGMSAAGRGRSGYGQRSNPEHLQLRRRRSLLDRDADQARGLQIHGYIQVVVSIGERAARLERTGSRVSDARAGYTNTRSAPQAQRAA